MDFFGALDKAPAESAQEKQRRKEKEKKKVGRKRRTKEEKLQDQQAERILELKGDASICMPADVVDRLIEEKDFVIGKDARKNPKKPVKMVEVWDSKKGVVKQAPFLVGVTVFGVGCNFYPGKGTCTVMGTPGKKDNGAEQVEIMHQGQKHIKRQLEKMGFHVQRRQKERSGVELKVKSQRYAPGSEGDSEGWELEEDREEERPANKQKGKYLREGKQRAEAADSEKGGPRRSPGPPSSTTRLPKSRASSNVSSSSALHYYIGTGVLSGSLFRFNPPKIISIFKL